jgi:thiamine pyrophosphate-dependent acetolactate synthase large subunit-like protein
VDKKSSDILVKLAELLQAPVYTAPFADGSSFPKNHKLFKVMLPAAIGPLDKRPEGNDLIVLTGTATFRYYPYEGGRFLPTEADLIHIVSGPGDSIAAIVGDSLITDEQLVIQPLLRAVPVDQDKARILSVTTAAIKMPRLPDKKGPNGLVTALILFTIVAELKPDRRQRNCE